MIPKSELAHGEYYYGHCRNASVARWNADQGCFIYRRHKFGHVFLEEINHPEDDNGFDLFKPKEVVTWGVEEIPFND